MTGLPAARQTDMTKHGGPITQGSLTVHIGTSGGVACSTCPGGVSVGNPVNPMLGAKVQSGEVDLALPGPMPFVLSRDYSSYQTDTPAPVGLLGPGWWLPTEVTLLQTADTLTLNDSKGRSIRFAPLAPGQAAYSRSENLWIVRGGLDRLDLNKELPVSRLNLAWMGLHEGDRRNPALFFVTNNLLGPWWVLGTTAPADQVTDKRLHLFGINDRFGRSLRLKRSAEGHVVAVQDGVGRQYRLELKTMAGLATEALGGWGADCGVRLMAVYLTHDPHEADPPHHPLVRYEYSPRGELIAVYGRDGNRNRAFQYHPQLLGRMTAHAYEGRPPVLYVYNEAGKVIGQQRQGALSYRFDYAQDSTTVTDSLGRNTIYHFEGQTGLRRVVKTQHPDGSITQSRFDGSGRLTASIDALGRETRYELDVATGNLLSITLPDGKQTRRHFNAQGLLVQVINSEGASEFTEYDGLGRPSASIDALGHATRYHYSGEHGEEPAVIEDPRGGKKHLSWNAAGRLIAYSDCSGSTTRYSYNRWGQLLGSVGEEATHSRSLYDDQGRLLVHTNALNQVTSYAYNAASDITSITGPDGNFVQFERNAHGQLVTYQYGGNSTALQQQFQYDEAGRLIKLTNENGAHTTFEYDVMDRLVKQVNFDGRIQGWSYNAAGEIAESHDGILICRYGYDKAGRLLQRQTNIQERPDDIQCEHFSYSEGGSLVKAWRKAELGSNTITVEFQRDVLGRITREIQSIVSIDGTQIWQHRVDHQFDALGSESQTCYTGLPAIEWQTYGSGHLHGVVLDGRSVIDFERDKLHRETKRQFGPTQTERNYDALSRLSSLYTHSPSIGGEHALKRLHHYDAAGQLTRIETVQGVHQYSYDQAGRLLSAIQPGLALQHYRFDPAGNRLFEATRATTAEANWDETVRQHMLDKSFNVLGANNEQDDQGDESKWIDNRIKDDGEFHYEHDAWGNLRRKHKAEGNEEHRYDYDSYHRLIRYTVESDTEVRGANYHYDLFGRRVAKEVQHADKDGVLVGGLITTFYGWDGDRLVLTEQGQKLIHTVYEPGRFVPMIRIEGEKAAPKHTLAQQFQVHDSVVERETLVILDDLEEELRQNSLSAFSQQLMQRAQLQPETLKNILDEASSLNGKQIYLYQCDHLGTPVALIDAQGKIAWAAQVGPWGDVVVEYNPQDLDQPIRLPGQHQDRESGLYYNRHRYYDPRIGRYINQDPIDLRGGANLYRYTFNPINQADVLGLNAVVWAAVEGAEAGGTAGAVFGPWGAAAGVVIGGVVAGAGAWWIGSKITAMATAKTAEELTRDHKAADGDRTKPGYGGNCTPDEHDDLKNKKEEACSNAAGLTCKEPTINYGIADTVQKCVDARIKIAKKCFGGGDSGHNEQINQLRAIIGKCTGHQW